MNKKIFKLTFSFVLLISASFAFASPVTVDDVCASLTKHTITTGNFIQEKTVPTLKRPLKSTGNFIFYSEGIMWNTIRPIASNMVVTEKAIIQTSPDGKRSVISGADSAVFQSIASTISALFKGNKADLERNFIVSVSDSGSTWKMNLVPRDSTISMVLASIELGGEIISGDCSFDTMKIAESGDSTIVYSFIDKVYKEKLTDEEKAYFSVQ